MSLNQWLQALAAGLKKTNRKKAGRRRSTSSRDFTRAAAQSELLENRMLLSEDPIAALLPSSGEDNNQDAPVYPVVASDDTVGRSAGSNAANTNAPGDARLVPPAAMLAIVDGGIEQYEAIIDAVRSVRIGETPMEVVVLDPARDGIDQITELLSSRRGLSAVHLFSHGNSGSLQLGSSTFDSASLSAATSKIQQWGKSLTEDADILLYGCQIGDGQPGIEFLNALSVATGADIAASTDLTGDSSLGGDWDLETTTGDVETAGLFHENAPQLQGVLASYSGSTLIAANGDLTSAGTTTDGTTHSQVVKTLDLSNLTGDLTVTLSKMTGAANAKVEVVSGGTKATYILPQGQGGVPKIIAGNGTQRLKFVLTKLGIGTLDVSSIANLQLAVGKNATATNGSITRGGSVSIVQNTASVGTVLLGKAGTTASVDVILRDGAAVGKIKKAGTFSGPLNLAYPDGPSESQPVRVDAKNIATIPIPGGTVIEGFTASAIQTIETDEGRQVIDLGSIAGATAKAGKGDDTLIAGTNNQTLEGGAGNDTYKLQGNWKTDTIVETQTGGTGDTLHFDSPGAVAITADIYSSVASSGPAGVQVVGTSDSTNRITNARFVESIVGGNAVNQYRFHDDWGYVSWTNAADQHTVFNIDDTASTSTKGILNFSTVTHDLEFTLSGNGEVKVIAKVQKNSGGVSKIFTYEVNATGIAYIEGGKGNNTYKINSDSALFGTIETPTGGRNLFDYSGYTDTAPVVIDTVAGVATGIHTANAPAANKELQTVNLAAAASGSFRLALGSVQTGDIAYGADANATQANIQAALDTLAGAGLFQVTNGPSNQWRVQFQLEANHPLLAVDGGKLRDAGNNAVNATVVTNQTGVAPYSATGFDHFHELLAGSPTAPLVVIYGTTISGGVADRGVIYSRNGDVRLTGTTGSDILVSYAGNDTIFGLAGDDQIGGGDGNNTLSGGSGDDIITSGTGNDILKGDAGNDTLNSGAGNDNLQGGPGDDILIGGPGDDIQSGGTGSDTYVLENGWGTDTIIEGKVDGTDVIDLSAVTNDLSFVLSNGTLVAGSGAVTIENKPGYFTGFRNITGSFGTGDLLTVSKAGSFNEVQAISLAGAKAGSSFTLTLNDTANGLTVNRSVTVGADDAVTATAIQTALNTDLGAGAVKVVVGSVSTFNVEFLKPANTNIAPLTLNTTGLTWDAPPVPVSLQAAAAGKNAIWQINLGMAHGGNFKLAFNNGTARTTADISVSDNPETTASNIAAEITAAGGAGAAAKVTVAGMGIYKIEFTAPAATSVTAVAVNAGTTALTYPTGISELQRGQSGADIQEIAFTNVASGTFKLKIGDLETDQITWDANPATTAANIQEKINLVRQSKYSLSKFNTTVKGSGTSSDQTFVVTFTGPKDKDVVQIADPVTTSLVASGGTVTAVVSTIQDGMSGGGPSAVETIKAPNADATLYFGNEIINSIWDVAKQALIPAEFRDYGELTIDSSVLTANGHSLTLDFSNVTRAMEFVFESTGETEIQKLVLNATESPVGSKFRLAVAGMTTGDITVGANDAATATAIQNALNTAFSGTALDGQRVEVKSFKKTPREFEINFKTQQQIGQLSAIQGTATGDAALTQAVIEVLRAGAPGQTQLTIEKTYQLPELFEGSYVADLWNELWGGINYDKVVITNVDANTTIIGGQNENTFKVVGDVAFPGTVVGLKGLRPLTSFLDYASLSGAVTLDIPNINTINTLDMSDSKATTPTVVNLTHLVSDGAVNSQTVTDAQDGVEVQRVIIPAATSGKFTISGFKSDGTTSFVTNDISLHGTVGAGPTRTISIFTAAEIAEQMELAINTALNEGPGKGVKVTPVRFTAGADGSTTAYDITFKQAGVDYKPLVLTENAIFELEGIVSLSAANVIAQGTPNASSIELDMTAVTGVTSVYLELETYDKVKFPTLPFALNTADMTTAITKSVAAWNLTSALGPVTVTSTVPSVYSISFPRGNVRIVAVRNNVDDSSVAAATHTIKQHAQKSLLTQKLTFGGATFGRVDVGY